MRKFLALLFALLLCTATKVYAEDAATVTVAVKDLPQKLQNRTVIVTLGNGPSDTESTVIVLDGLNNYTEMVTVAPSEYYWTGMPISSAMMKESCFHYHRTAYMVQRISLQVRF